MCGIVAGSSVDVIDFNDIRLGLLNADDRGGHSCGVALRGKKDIVIRQVSDAKVFINDANSDVKFPRQSVRFIGHTRYATKGAKTTGNAHPFIFGDIVGVHNGTIENFEELKKEYIDDYRNDVDDWYVENGGDWKKGLDVEKKEDIDVESDSKLLYYLIWKFGLQGALPKLKGTLGLVFFKKEQDKEYLYMYRWDKPLCYGRKDGVLFIGSLKKYLDSLGCEDIKSVTEHSIYKVDAGKIVTAKQQKQSIKPKKSTYKYCKDYDPVLEPEKKHKARSTTSATNTSRNTSKSYGRTTTGFQTSTQNVQSNEEDDTDLPFQFVAPRCAKGEIDVDGLLALYWFSTKEANQVYIEKDQKENIDSYDLNLTSDVQLLEEDYPNLYEFIMDDYMQISATLEYRDNINEYAS